MANVKVEQADDDDDDATLPPPTQYKLLTPLTPKQLSDFHFPPNCPVSYHHSTTSPNEQRLTTCDGVIVAADLVLDPCEPQHPKVMCRVDRKTNDGGSTGSTVIVTESVLLSDLAYATHCPVEVTIEGEIHDGVVAYSVAGVNEAGGRVFKYHILIGGVGSMRIEKDVLAESVRYRKVEVVGPPMNESKGVLSEGATPTNDEKPEAQTQTTFLKETPRSFEISSRDAAIPTEGEGESAKAKDARVGAKTTEQTKPAAVSNGGRSGGAESNLDENTSASVSKKNTSAVIANSNLNESTSASYATEQKGSVGIEKSVLNDNSKALVATSKQNGNTIGGGDSNGPEIKEVNGKQWQAPRRFTRSNSASGTIPLSSSREQTTRLPNVALGDYQTKSLGRNEVIQCRLTVPVWVSRAGNLFRKFDGMHSSLPISRQSALSAVSTNLSFASHPTQFIWLEPTLPERMDTKLATYHTKQTAE